MRWKRILIKRWQGLALRCEKCGWLLRLNYLFCWRHASCQTDIIVFSCEYWLPTANGSCGAPRAGPHFGCVERDGPTFTFIYLIKSRLVVTIKRGSNYPLLMLPVFFFFYLAALHETLERIYHTMIDINRTIGSIESRTSNLTVHAFHLPIY
jgi:hypothetical protein